MATTIGVLTGLGTVGRPVYREFDNTLGIMVLPRSRPRCLTSALEGYFLGLHDYKWSLHEPRAASDSTYWVRVVPVFDDMIDPDGLPLMGTPTLTPTAQGTEYTFDPFPDGYACTGYRVYAHDGLTETADYYYYQGALAGRFNTVFTINSTWTYLETGAVLSPQTIGPPCFATAMDIYQSEGQADSRIFLGGGRKYETGYARVAKATAAPILTGGTDAESAFATWATISNGSFRMRLGWTATVAYDEYFDWTGIDFSGCGSMANVATVFQNTIRAAKGPALYCGTNETTGVTAWQAATDGSLQIWVNGAVVQLTSMNFGLDSSLSEVAARIQAAWRAAGDGTEVVTYDSVAERFIFKSEPAAPTAASLLSYLEPHSNGTGTDVSGMLDGRADGIGVVLNRRGKGATTAETVTWSTDHFVFRSSTTGDDSRMGYMTVATANVGTDVSTSTYGDLRETSNLCVYTPGKTAARTVEGDGVEWGAWAIGMRFKLQSESTMYIILDVVDENHILIDSDYSGAGFQGWSTYILLPYDHQVYPSALGNPFKYTASDIIPMPIGRSDYITCIKSMGRNMVVYMRGHIWLIDGVDITAPRLLTDQYGVINSDCVIPFGNGHAFFTGDDFMFLSGGKITSLDPDGRMKQAVSRISTKTPEPHGRYLPTPQAKLLIWWVGMDDSSKYDTAFVCEPESGNWWLYNHKDANCSAIIRDDDDTQYLITGSTYDKGHSAPAFTFLHGLDYKNDGASVGGTTTKQGLISAVGAATTTAGYLTCGATGSPLASWQAISSGYFDISIDGTDYTVGPCDFSSGMSDFDDIAAAIQAAIRVQTSSTETCVYDTDHFIITSATTTNQSIISYLSTYKGTDATDISSKTYMNGRDGYATMTYPVTQRVLSLQTFGSVDAALSVAADAEKGIYLFVCDSNLENGQFALVVSNTAATITVTPNFSTTPVAGWYWFLGCIVPQWSRHFDFGSPQHKNKLSSVSVSVKPEANNTGNYLGVQFFQDLTTTVRVARKNEIGGGNDVTQTFKPSDQPATHHGFKILRPSSEDDFKIESIVIVHRPNV